MATKFVSSGNHSRLPFVTVSRSSQPKQKPLHRRRKGRLRTMSKLTGVVIATMLIAISQTSHCAQLEVPKNWDYNGCR